MRARHAARNPRAASRAPSCKRNNSKAEYLSQLSKGASLARAVRYSVASGSKWARPRPVSCACACVKRRRPSIPPPGRRSQSLTASPAVMNATVCSSGTPLPIQGASSTLSCTFTWTSTTSPSEGWKDASNTDSSSRDSRSHSLAKAPSTSCAALRLARALWFRNSRSPRGRRCGGWSCLRGWRMLSRPSSSIPLSCSRRCSSLYCRAFFAAVSPSSAARPSRSKRERSDGLSVAVKRNSLVSKFWRILSAALPSSRILLSGIRLTRHNSRRIEVS